MNKDFDITNTLYEQGLYLSENLDVMGPLHRSDRYNFSFIRSYAKAERPIHPSLHSLATIRYPCIMHCAPYRSATKVFLQNFYYPEYVNMLDLGYWKLIIFVENCFEEAQEAGQIQTFTALVRAPDKKLCLVSFKVHQFDDNFA